RRRAFAVRPGDVDRRKFPLRIVQGAGQRADAFEPELHRQRFVPQAVEIIDRFFKVHRINRKWGMGSGGARERESGRAGDKGSRRDLFSAAPSLPRSLAPPLPRSLTPHSLLPTPHSVIYGFWLGEFRRSA